MRGDFNIWLIFKHWYNYNVIFIFDDLFAACFPLTNSDSWIYQHTSDFLMHEPDEHDHKFIRICNIRSCRAANVLPTLSRKCMLYRVDNYLPSASDDCDNCVQFASSMFEH